VSVLAITGASGFVGANLVRHFAARGDDVHILLRPHAKMWRLDDVAGYVRHDVDFTDAGRLQDVFGKIRPRYVLHLAAYGAYEDQADIATAVETNVKSTMLLMECAREAGVERFINTGSSSEYGYKDHPPAETELPEPNSLYAVTKTAATFYGQYLAAKFGFHVTTLRLYSVYGPYEEPTRLIPRIIVCANRGTYPPLVSPATARDFIHVDDVCRAYESVLATATHAGQIYNIGTALQTSLAEVVDAARALFHLAQAPVWGSMPQRRWDTNIWVANTEKIRAELEWRPSLSFTEGLQRAASWLTGNPNRLRFYENYGTPK
jgi:nucleoside-diphosphate-sugar epimerase